MEYTGQTFFKIKETVSDAVITLDVSDSLYLGIAAKRHWQAQVDPDGSVGTIKVEGKTPGASGYVDIVTLDLSDPLDTDGLTEFTGAFESLRLTPDSLNGNDCDIFFCGV